MFFASRSICAPPRRVWVQPLGIILSGSCRHQKDLLQSLLFFMCSNTLTLLASLFKTQWYVSGCFCQNHKSKAAQWFGTSNARRRLTTLLYLFWSRDLKFYLSSKSIFNYKITDVCHLCHICCRNGSISYKEM